MERLWKANSGRSGFLGIVTLATAALLVGSAAAQPQGDRRERPVHATAVEPADAGSIQVIPGDGPGAIDREAILEAARELLGSDVAVEDIRLGEILDRLESAALAQGARLPHRRVLAALARSVSASRGPIEEMRLGDFLDRLRPVQVRVQDGRRAVDGVGLVDLARALLGSVDRVDHAADPRSGERHALQLQYAAAAVTVAQLRREGFAKDDVDAIYEEARRRLHESGRADAAGLLDGMRWIEHEMAATDPKPITRAGEIALLQEARRHAFGPEMAGLLFSREEAMERYEVDRMDLEADPTLSTEDRPARLRARREELRVELAAEGTYVSFVDRESGATAPAEPPDAPEASAVTSQAAPSILAATQCDTDPAAVPFQATVDPSLLNDYLTSLPNVPVGKTYPVGFGGICVDHRLDIVLAGSAATQQSAFLVTPSLGALQVQLYLGVLNGSLAVQNYRTINCGGFGCFDWVCAAEEAAVRAMIGSFNGSVSASSVQVTQLADTCVLGDCTAVHPLDSTTATVAGFNLNVLGSCEVCFLDWCLDPCSFINHAIRDLIDWLVDIGDLIAGFFVADDGTGVLINIFANDIVKDGCLPVSEVIQCRRAGAPAPAVAGFVRAPRGGGLNALLYAVPLFLAIGAIVRLRRRRKD